MVLHSASPERPISSSGIPLVDTRFKRASSTWKARPSPLSIPQETTRDFSAESDEYAAVSEVAPAFRSLGMGSMGEGAVSQGHLGTKVEYHNLGSDRSRDSSRSASTKSKGKDGKSRWLSQLKGWVSMSEPSTQALKQYRENTYKKAGISLGDPRANAKLHLPVGTLPPEAIKPAGRELDPEKMALKKAELRRKMRESYHASMGTYQGSRSTISHSSSSSVDLGGWREEE
ncbi:hypothetical protein GGR56DRAFT_207152 [Xylariaceae sp. FL0804]|nr:hypothetical protein GGR56DRAFT_207152 [Xylariaceae sp. FL0804]